MRTFQGPLARIVTITAVVMSVYHLYIGIVGPPEANIQRSLHLLFTVVLLFLLYPAKEGGSTPITRYDFGLLALAAAPLLYHLIFNDYVVLRHPFVEPLSHMEVFLGISLIILIIEGCRRTLGKAMAVVIIAFLTYSLSGSILPGPLQHRQIGLEELIDHLFLTPEGIFGIPIGVSADYVILFIIFGAFLEKSGTGELFTDFAKAITGSSPGGPGKISCVSSALFGTISGSAVANVMVDGWLTIPLMKRTGFKAEFAAAIEAVASTGGQIMPPVMGAAAFIMASFLGISYSMVCLHAAIPAILYYATLFGSVHYYARKEGLKGVPRKELPSLKGVLLERGHLFISIVVLITFMSVGFTPIYSAIIATFSVLICSYIRKGTRLGFRKTIEALQSGAENTVPIAVACAGAGIIIGCITATGLGLQFTALVVRIGGDNLIVALLFTMLAGIILGMGVPTTGAYIIQAALIIPALIKLDVSPVAAHMFVFYFACLSAITPPVAMAVYAAAPIAKSNLWATGLNAVKIGLAGFIVPFMFVYWPSLLFIGDIGDILGSFISGFIGCLSLAAGIQGWVYRKTSLVERVLLISAALLLMKPGYISDAIGIVFIVFVVINQKTDFLARKGRKPSAGE